MNRDKWKALSTANKKLMLKYSAKLGAAVSFTGYGADRARAEAAAKKKGLVWTNAGQDFADFMVKFRATQMAGILKRAKKRGVKNPQKIIDTHLAAVTKWEKILAGKSPSADEFADLLWKHIYSKLDPEKI